MEKSRYQLTSTPIAKAVKFCVYGSEGVGKTTLASKLPSPIFIDTEGSTEHMTLCRYPRPHDWLELMDMVDDASKLKTRTLVIDTLDWADLLCVKSLCKEMKWKSIEDGGYGKGYVMLAEKFSELLEKLSALANRGVNVGFTAHAQLRKIERPEETGAYDHWEMKCSKKVSPLVREWCDLMLFCNYDSVIIHGNNPMESNKITGNKRVMYANHQPTFDAKNRFGLPDKMPLDYEPLRQIFERAQPIEIKPQVEAAPEMPDDPFLADDVSGAAGTPKPESEWTEEEKKSVEPVSLVDAFPELEALMKRDGVTYSMVQYAVSRKGHHPADLPIELYPVEYVNRLVSGWDKFAKYAKSL